MALMAMEADRVAGYGNPFFPESNAIGPAGQYLKGVSEDQVRTAAQESEFWRILYLCHIARSKILELALLKSNWDSYGAPRPNLTAINGALRILRLMKTFNLGPLNIVPSAEGGIGFCFVKDKRYADIEVSNDGDILGVRYVGMETPILINVDGDDASIRTALEEIGKHINT